MRVMCTSTSRLSKIQSGRLRERGLCYQHPREQRDARNGMFAAKRCNDVALNEPFLIPILLGFPASASYFCRQSVHFSRAGDRCSAHPAVFSSRAHGFQQRILHQPGFLLVFRTHSSIFWPGVRRDISRGGQTFFSLSFFVDGISRLGVKSRRRIRHSKREERTGLPR